MRQSHFIDEYLFIRHMTTASRKRPVPVTPATAATAARIASLRKVASRWPFGPKSMSESRRNSQWMETHKRNHAHANLHGSARQLAWLDLKTAICRSKWHTAPRIIAPPLRSCLEPSLSAVAFYRAVVLAQAILRTQAVL